MPASPLMTAQALHDLATNAGSRLLICDCRHDLVDTGLGLRVYQESHIPSAVFVSVDQQLSAAKSGTNGRHPLPDSAIFAQTLASMGVNDDTTIVAYDNTGGQYAARLWWMARWVGHANVFVLDAGLNGWTRAGFALTTEVPAARAMGNFKRSETLTSSLNMAEVRDGLNHPERLIVDARPVDRFQGLNETLDPKAGHIPGSVSRPTPSNLQADGTFKDSATLQAEFATLLGNRSAHQVVASCGSGIAACHLLLSMQIAGLPGAALYGGSWSEWSTQPDAPVELGTGLES